MATSSKHLARSSIGSDKDLAVAATILPMHVILVKRIIQDQLYSVVQFDLNKTKLGKASPLINIILDHAI